MRKFHFILRAISNFSRVQFFYVGHQLQLVNLHSRKRGQTVFWHPLNRINQANLAGQTHPIHPSWPGLRNPNAGSHILRRKFSLFALTREGGGRGGVTYPVTHLTFGNVSFSLIHQNTLTHTLWLGQIRRCLSTVQPFLFGMYSLPDTPTYIRIHNYLPTWSQPKFTHYYTYLSHTWL